MATLVYSDVDGVDRSFALGMEPLLVGRDVQCAIRSDDPRVSRLHARFFIDGGLLWVEDLQSANGIFVGPNKVQRAPVPTGEIILVGSLMIRLLPASGTLPPPVGLHGTLASWLDLERKSRAAIEEERDAFARRVAELSQQLRSGGGGTIDPEAIRLRDEAEARAAGLEQALGAVQEELAMSRLSTGEVSRLQEDLAAARGHADEMEAAASVAEQAQAVTAKEAEAARAELEELRGATGKELEALRLELAKAKEVRMVMETQVGVATAGKLAEADLVIANLTRELDEARAANLGPDQRVADLNDQLAASAARVAAAEKDLAAAQIRAQGAERNLAGATMQTAKAEGRTAGLEQRISEAEARAVALDEELVEARERTAQLESRLGAGDAPLQAAEARASKLAAELADISSQFETRRDRLVELEKAAAAAGDAVKAIEARGESSKAATAVLATKLVDAERKVAELEARIAELAKADAAIAVATKARDEAIARATVADKRVTDAEGRAEDAEKRGSAADTMAKAMAKDVAEALRRAADADTRAKTVNRDLADAFRRAEEAEQRATASTALVAGLEKQASEAAARAAEVAAELAARLEQAKRDQEITLEQTREQLTVKLEETRDELTARFEQMQKQLTGKLEQAQRELAAERSTSLQLVDRKTAIERELLQLREARPELEHRAETAESRVVELEVQLESLQERVVDLESGLAVAETAHQATGEESQQRLALLESQLADPNGAATKSNGTAESLRAKLALIDKQLRDTEEARITAVTELTKARAHIDELSAAAEQHAGMSLADRDQIDDALARAKEAEGKLARYAATEEAAELAIGRAGALQRQLDEAISKLAFLERDATSSKGKGASELAETTERLASADKRLVEAEKRAARAEALIKENEAELAEVATRAQRAEEVNRSSQADLGEAERRVADNERRVADAERRAADADRRASEALNRATKADGELEHKLAAAVHRINELEVEIAKADNVRSFAAETEREIAQFQRDLREAKAKVTQLTLERDRLASELRDSRGDSETTNRRAPIIDPEATAQADVARYREVIEKATEAEQKLLKAEKDNAALKKQVAEAKARMTAAEAQLSEHAEATHNQLPLGQIAEQMSVLEESIDSLKANMRAASDETAVMPQTESVMAVASAVSQAAEHIERARIAIRLLGRSLGS